MIREDIVCNQEKDYRSGDSKDSSINHISAISKVVIFKINVSSICNNEGKGIDNL